MYQAHRAPLAPIDRHPVVREQPGAEAEADPVPPPPTYPPYEYSLPADSAQQFDIEASLASLRRDALQRFEQQPGSGNDTTEDYERLPFKRPQFDREAVNTETGPVEQWNQGDPNDQERYDSYNEESTQRSRPKSARSPAFAEHDRAALTQDRLVLNDSQEPDDEEPTEKNSRIRQGSRGRVTFELPPAQSKTVPGSAIKSRARSASPSNRKSVVKSRTSLHHSAVSKPDISQTSTGRAGGRTRSPFRTRSLIHMSTLVTKSPGPPPKAPEKVTFAQLADHGMRFMHIGSHDWACNCRVPQTVSRIVLDRRAAGSQVPSVRSKRQYMVPAGSTLVDKGHQEPAGQSAKGQMMVVDSKQDTRQLSAVSSGMKNKVSSELSKGPISARNAFLVSGPHWQSRSHTQRWAWKGKLESHVWPHPAGGLRLVDASSAPRSAAISTVT